MHNKKGKIISLHPNPLFLANEYGKEEGGNMKQQNQRLAIIKSPMCSLRGLHNVVAYLECLAISYDPNRFGLTNYNYDLAMLLPPWKAIYTTDNERKESFEEAEKLYFYIKNTYQNQRIPINEIPFQSPEARISSLLQYLDHGKDA